MKEWRRSADLEQAAQSDYPRRMITALEGPSSDETEFNESEQDPTSTVVLFRAVSPMVCSGPALIAMPLESSLVKREAML